MKTLKLADGLALPADEAVTQKYGFIGRSGSGKSYAAMRLAELFLGAGAQIIALDWVGIWWSLRLHADGKTPGFQHVYIFGGEHADVDLRPESGALMADLVVDKHISVVLDVMHFRKAERTRFATAFAEQFFHRKKTARTACHLFIEEAQAYLPQMVRGDEARMVGVFEDIGKVGRNYGIGNSLISQRPQAINKDVLNQIEVLLAFQTNGPQERKAIAGWTSENTTAGAAMIQELPKLRTGHALVWSPQWLRIAEQVHISKRDTYDASSTPTQQAKSIAPKTLAKADLEQLGQEIAATIEKAKADDPRELRRQIAELKKQLGSKLDSPAPIAQKEKRVDVLTDADRALLAKLADGIGNIKEFLVGGHQTLFDEAYERMLKVLHAFRDDSADDISKMRANFEQRIDTKGLNKILDKLAAVQPPQNTHAPIATGSRTNPAASQGRRVAPVAATNRPTSLVSQNGTGKPGAAQRAFLTALAHRNGKTTTRNQLAVFTGYSAKSSHVDNVLSSLRTAGWATGSREAIAITGDGLSALGEYEPLPTGDALIAHWVSEAGAAAGAMLKALVKAYPNTMTRDEVAEATGYSVESSHVDNSVSRLRTLQLVTGGRNDLRASEELFS